MLRPLALFVDPIYNDVTSFGGPPIVIATLFFAIQIYCDFSGYSDIAIGAARIMGFKLMDNFKRPYFARTIQDFWRRWHISLSTWFRDYVYIPLGGSRVKKRIWYSNIFVVFVIAGLVIYLLVKNAALEYAVRNWKDKIRAECFNELP